jgi:hypothetical protein
MAVDKRKATRDEVLAHRAKVRRLVGSLGLDNPRIRDDGALIVHNHEAGYRAVARLAAMASDLVDKDVFVITDDVPGAATTQEF